MNSLLLLFIRCFAFIKVNAQLYINGDITIQNGETLYADDTIQLGSLSAVLTNGILQSSKAIQTKQSIINTGSSGYIISPVQSNLNSPFNLGTGSSNNRITIQHSSIGAVDYKLAVRDNVYANPSTNNSAITSHSIDKTWIVQPLSNSINTSFELQWSTTNEQSGFNRNNCGLAQWQSGVSSSWSMINGTSAANNLGSAFSKTNSFGNLNAGTYYYNVGDNTNPYSLKSTLNLIAFLEGLYLGNGTMIASPFSADGISPNNVADTISVELHEANSPHLLTYQTKGVVSTNGIALVNFPSTVNTNSYYVAIKHRNSVETWSTNPVLFSASTSYNFSTSAIQAYGSNLSDMGNGIFAIYSGDINQDGSVDFNDYPDLDISSSNGDLGYLPYDLNGDASVDFNDYPILDINSSNGIITITP